MSLNGIDAPDRRELARELGVSVLAGAPNPWSLLEVGSSELAGLDAREAVANVQRLFQRKSLDLTISLVPLSGIAYRLYDELAEQALERGIVVGLGLNAATLNGNAEDSRHVVRVVRASSREVWLVDDNLGAPPQEFSRSWEVVEQAVHSVGDGFWLIGRPETLHFPSLCCTEGLT